jgi:hypothetical protein
MLTDCPVFDYKLSYFYLSVCYWIAYLILPIAVTTAIILHIVIFNRLCVVFVFINPCIEWHNNANASKLFVNQTVDKTSLDCTL